MQDAGDMELLWEYAHGNSEEAFAALVTRHTNLVYSVALRKTGDAHAAQEITQAVFVLLARKARALCRGTILPGWTWKDCGRMSDGLSPRGSMASSPAVRRANPPP